MDEPLSNLDAKLRVEMRAEISRIQRDLGVTTIYVTHDQTEAMTMGDRVAVLRGGFLQQVGGPQLLYDQPVNLFVAEFIGSPAMNLVQGRLMRADGGLAVQFGEHSLGLPEDITKERTALASFVDRDVVLGIRPEDMEDAALVRDVPPNQTLAVVNDIREDMGAEVFLHFSVHAQPVRATEVTEALEHEEYQAIEERARRAGVPFIARVERLTQAREGERILLVVDVQHLHFFDPETGLGIYDGVLP
jgi:multiple sugar transport system ATP-binding protein